jgi:hypothetical protein
MMIIGIAGMTVMNMSKMLKNIIYMYRIVMMPPEWAVRCGVAPHVAYAVKA